MTITEKFVKLRSKGTPKTGEWNIDYKKALALAKKNGKFIVAFWSNGDKCGYCTTAETCMMQSVFKDWMAKQDAYFVFQYSGDKDRGQTLHDLIYASTKLRYYPGFRIMLYDANGKAIYDQPIEGNKLRANKIGVNGAKEMVAKLSAMFAKKPAKRTVEKAKAVTTYKVRLNEKLTTKQVNKILDSIDACGGYCPCQMQSEETKCHCKDFVENKKIGEPCICNIYVKQEKTAQKKSSEKKRKNA